MKSLIRLLKKTETKITNCNNENYESVLFNTAAWAGIKRWTFIHLNFSSIRINQLGSSVYEVRFGFNIKPVKLVVRQWTKLMDVIILS